VDLAFVAAELVVDVGGCEEFEGGVGLAKLSDILRGERPEGKAAMSELRYTVSLQRSKEGFSVWVPGLPGCASQGDTEAEALENIRVAIDEYLSVADELSGVAERREVVVHR
jgi:predicted RNase H-like HicB family nuclease